MQTNGVPLPGDIRRSIDAAQARVFTKKKQITYSSYGSSYDSSSYDSETSSDEEYVRNVKRNAHKASDIKK